MNEPRNGSSVHIGDRSPKGPCTQIVYTLALIPPIVNVSCCIWVVRVRGRQGRRQTYRNVSGCIVCWFSHQEHGNRTYRMYPGVSALLGEGSRERIQTYPVVSCAGSGLACWTYLNVSWGIWWKRFALCILFEP